MKGLTANESTDAGVASASAAGHICIQLNLDWEGSVVEVIAENFRPKNIGRLFIEASAEQVLEQIPKLFLLCSQAQQVAAVGALAQAKQLEVSKQFKQHCAERCALEWIKEHSWQLWQMERELFGEQFAMQDSLALTQCLLKSLQLPPLTLDMVHSKNLELVNEPIWRDIEQKLVQLFGIAPREFLGMDWQQLLNWSQTYHPYAQLMRSLLSKDVCSFGDTGCSPDAEESGALARLNHPLVEQAKNKFGTGLATRTLARLVELASVAQTPEFAAVNQLGTAEASRGVLKHQVSFNDQGLVSNYQIDAPTDRLFCSDGLIEKALLGQRIPEQDLKWVRLLVWAIDPCVEFSVNRMNKN